MAPPSVQFSKGGGPLSVIVQFQYNIAGGYELDLWKGTAKTVVGNGVNDIATRTWPLAGPAAGYDQQVLAWDITLGEMLNGDDQYLVDITIQQDGKTLFSHPWHDKFGSQHKLEIFGGVTLVGS